MATFTVLAEVRIGKRRLNIVKIAWTGDAYPSGGIALTPTQLGMKSRIDSVVPLHYAATSGGNPIGMMQAWNQNTQKLAFFWPTGGAASPGAINTAPQTTMPAGGTAVTSTAANPALDETAGVGREVTISITSGSESFLMVIGY